MTQKEETAEKLKEAKEILDILGVKFWLTLGTALGAYRDGDFCPGDIDDIDLCVDYKCQDKENEVVDKFLKEGWTLKAVWKAEDGISTEYSFTKGVAKVDLWYYSPNPKNENELLFRMYRTNTEYNTFILPKRFHDKFREVDFYGTKYLIPDDIEGYLEHNYGKDWKTPIHRNNWDYYTANYSPKV